MLFLFILDEFKQSLHHNAVIHQQVPNAIFAQYTTTQFSRQQTFFVSFQVGFPLIATQVFVQHFDVRVHQVPFVERILL